MSLRSPNPRARDLGSAKEGVAHWWAQRVTAVALVPLTLWFVIDLAAVAGRGYEATVAWIGSPVRAVLLLLFIAAAFHHAQLGVQVVVEDYVKGTARRIASLVLLRLATLALAVAAAFAVLSIAFGT